MTKKILLVFVTILIAIAAILLFIPRKINVASSISYSASSQGVFDFLTVGHNWNKWWPETSAANNEKTFISDGYKFSIVKPLYHAIELRLTKSNQSLLALMQVIPLKADSTGIELTTEIDAGNNPFSRIKSYFEARKIKKSFIKVIQSLASYTKVVKNLYGFYIRNEKVQMQHLLQTSATFSHYPTTKDIYSLVERIRSYLNTTDGKEEFFPMLNIQEKDSVNYLVRVGLPVNKKLEETKDISLKMMVKNGNILVTDVIGDNQVIEQALKQTEKYIQDYQRSIIALPFQLLETDRLKETDSTKWVTKIYYPVV